MPMLFDATLKDMVRRHVPDFETRLGLSGPQPVAVLNVDLSTLSAAADVVLGYGSPPASLVDLHFQSSRDDDLPARALLYNGALYYRYRVPVHSLVVLLRPAANDPSLDEGIHYAVWPERGRTDLRIEVVRLWQRPVAEFLAGGLGTLPLAPLCQMPEGVSLEAALPAVIHQVAERLTREATPEEAARLLSATFVLTGLRVTREATLAIFQGVRGMRESTTYQYILDEGRLEEAKKLLLLLGADRFGPPSEAEVTTLSGLTDLARVERMSRQLLRAANWQELLATP